MKVEFFYPKDNATVKRVDYVKIDNGGWIALDQLDENTLLQILHEMRDNEVCNATISKIRKTGVTDVLEIIRQTARKHFAELDKKPDIDTDTHAINLEHK